MKAPLRILTLAIALLPILANAQKAPGYLGKRFSIEYTGYLFPSFANPNSPEVTYDIYDDPDVSFSMNWQHHLTGQWSFSKRASLIADFSYTNTNFIPYGYGFRGITYEGYPQVTATTYNAGMRIYFQHYAPLGRYFEFRVGAANVVADDFRYRQINSSAPLDTMQTIVGGSTVRPNIAIAWGTSRVIKDILIISYGFDINFVVSRPGYLNTLLSQPENSDLDYDFLDSPNNEKAYMNLAAGRYTMHSLLNLRLGIGILL